MLFLGLLVRAARRPAPALLNDRPRQRFYAVGKAFVELKRREIGHRRRRGDTVDDDDGRSPDSVLFGAPRFGARLPARFGNGRSAESEELLSIERLGADISGVSSSHHPLPRPRHLPRHPLFLHLHK